MARIVIVGGGITGLSAAYELRGSGSHTVELLESEERLGGKIRTTRADGFLLDEGPDSLLTRKRGAVELCAALGIDGRFVGRTPRRCGSLIHHAQRLHPLPEGFSGLVPSDPDALESSSLLSDEAKARVRRERDIPAPADEVGEESVASFLSRRFGREAFEVMIEPLVSGIFAGDARFLSIQSAFPQLVELERSRGSLSAPPPRGASTPDSADRGTAARLPTFVSFPLGMAEIVTAILSRLTSLRITTGASVNGIRRLKSRFLVGVEGGGGIEADAVIVAIPAHQAAGLVTSLDGRLAETLAAIEYASTVVVNLGYHTSDVPHELDGYGYLVPMVDGRRFHGCSWSSSKWPGRAPEGSALLRLYGGRYAEEDLLQMSDEAIEAEARSELELTLGITVDPMLCRITRWQKALPQYNLGHRSLLEAIEERLEANSGLFLAGAAFRGVGIPDCIDSGRSAARAALGHINTNMRRAT